MTPALRGRRTWRAVAAMALAVLVVLSAAVLIPASAGSGDESDAGAAQIQPAPEPRAEAEAEEASVEPDEATAELIPDAEQKADIPAEQTPKDASHESHEDGGEAAEEDEPRDDSAVEKPAPKSGPAAAEDADAPLDVSVTVSQNLRHLHVRATVRALDGSPPPAGVQVRGAVGAPWGRGFTMNQVSPGVYEWTSPERRPDDYTVTVTAIHEGTQSQGSATGRIVGTDSTPPVVSVTARNPTSTTWFIEPVTVSMSAADPQGVDRLFYYGHPDPGSAASVEAASHQVTYDTDGVRTLRVSASDTLGNISETESLRVPLDTSAPTAEVGGVLDEGWAWKRAEVRAELECADPTSGVAQCYLSLPGGRIVRDGNVLPTSEVGPLAYELVAVNSAGLVTTVPGELEIVDDTTPPTVTIETDPIASNARGWFLRDVTVRIDASDAGSGAAWIEHDADGTMRRQHWSSVSFQVPTDGVHTYAYRAGDRAGNETSIREREIKVDRVAPEITVAAPVDGGTVAVGSELIADFACSDATSGVATCEGSVAAGDPLPTDTAGDHELTIRSSDVAGHYTTRTVRYTVVETTLGASVTPSEPSNAAGWWRDDVTLQIDPLPGSGATTVHWSLDGAQSGTGSADGSGEVTITSEGTTQLRYWAENAQGDRSEPELFEVQLDRTGPRIATLPGGDLVLEVGQDATWDFTCTDDLSGVDACRSELTIGQVLESSTPGTFTVLTEATDVAGNAVTDEFTYRVVAADDEPGGADDPREPIDDREDRGDASLPDTGAPVKPWVPVLALALVLGGCLTLRPWSRELW